jgi:uncharacterized protein (DUF427 family)
MKQITYKTQDGKIIAQGILDTDVFMVEGNYYFDRSKVDFGHLIKKENAYFCPIKKSPCDYYFLDTNPEREIAWIYETVTNSVFQIIAGKVGFYPRSSTNLELIIA